MVDDTLEEKFATLTRVALLEDHYKDIKGQFVSITTDIKALGKQVDLILATKITDHTQIFSSLKTQEDQIKALQKQSGFWRWASPTLAAVASSTMTFLIIFYLQHVK